MNKIFSFVPKDHLFFENVDTSQITFLEIDKLESPLKNTFDKKWRSTFQTFLSSNIKGETVFQSLKEDKHLNYWFSYKFTLYYQLKQDFFEFQTILHQNLEKGSTIYTQRNSIANSELSSDYNIVKLNSKPKKRIPFFSKLKTLFIFLRIFFTRVIQSSRAFNKDQNSNRILVHGNKNSNRILNLDGKSFSKKNPYWGYLFDKYPTKFEVIDELDISKETANFTLKWNPKFTESIYKDSVTIDYIIFRYLINPIHFFREIKHSLSLKNRLKTIDANIIEFGSKIISSFYCQNFLALIYFRIKRNAVAQFLKNNKKDKNTIVTYGERTSGGYYYISAGNKQNYKTLALQHGIISHYNIAYNLNDTEVLEPNLPTKTLTWGSSYSSVLEKENYAKSEIQTIGQIRTDIIPILMNQHNKSTLKHSKTVVFFSQPQPNYLKDRFNEVSALIKAFKTLSDIKLIIKLHPIEEDDIFTKLILENNVSNVEIDSTTDTYTSIAMSDMCITCYSTVGYEVLYFKKDLMHLDFRKKDLANFTKDNISIPLYSEMDIIHQIQSFFKNRTEKTFKQQEYLDQKLYKGDGQCSERIFKLIETEL